ncbi:unnamed protein product [Dovyalis caffra]|uniref:Mannosyltransferase n=1 Tax=Dovyalis caffra TaxID=77055 RepID=A0AAV1RRG8_9ROSI|nr:unnamed protein product [Dovyalis caffra]
MAWGWMKAWARKEIERAYFAKLWAWGLGPRLGLGEKEGARLRVFKVGVLAGVNDNQTYRIHDYNENVVHVIIDNRTNSSNEGDRFVDAKEMGRRNAVASKSQPTKPLTTKVPDISKQEENKSRKSNFFSSDKNIFTLCFAFRIANSLLIQTYFNPDEHWQALEVAHRIVFGLETVLTLVGLYYWPCMGVSSSKAPLVSRKWGLAIAALACAIRPTSAITWVYVGLLELAVTRDRLRFLVLEVVPIGALVIGLSCLLDRLMYNSWVIVPVNFIKFNFLSSGGDYYGTHKWHWYFSQGFSVMVFTFLPFSIAGCIKSKCWKLSGLIAWVLIVYSILGHKEFRFVLPVLPIALMFSGYSLAAMARSDTDSRRKVSPDSHMKRPSKVGFAIFFLLVTNIPMALYMSLVHQRGTEDVMIYLSKEAQNDKVKSILFLTPCHATPYYSTLHYDLPMRILDCSPSEEKGIPDESDRFMMDPIRRFFHAHFKVDRDLQASVVKMIPGCEEADFETLFQKCIEHVMKLKLQVHILKSLLQVYEID